MSYLHLTYMLDVLESCLDAAWPDLENKEDMY